MGSFNRNFSFPSTTKLFIIFVFTFTNLLYEISAAPTISEEKSTFLGELQNYASDKKCLFPIQTPTDKSDLFFTSSIDKSCGNRTSKSVQDSICIVISDQIRAICNKTTGYETKLSEVSSVSVTIADNPLIKRYSKSNESEFCKELITDEGIPKKSDVQKEIQSFYATFIDPSDQKKCSEVCKAPLGIEQDLKINPLCIFLKLVSSVRQKVDETVNDSIKGKGVIEENMEKNVPELGNMPQGDDPSKTKTSDVNIKKSEVSGNSPQQNVADEIVGSVSGKPRPLISSSSESSLKSSSISLAPVPDQKNKQELSRIPPAVLSSSTTSTSTQSSAGVSANSDEEIPSPPIGKVDTKSPLPSAEPNSKNEKLNPNVADEKHTKPKQDKIEVESNDPDQKLSSNYDDNIAPPDDSDDITLDQGSKKQPDVEDTGLKKEEQNNTDLIPDADSGGSFNYFIFFLMFLALCFLAFHNKRRLIAYVVEGKKPRQSRTRRQSSSASGASYRRLENNFE